MSFFSSSLRSQVILWLTDQVPPRRLQHILRVEAMAVALAKHHGVDGGRAAQAGLMHDLAKCFKPERLLTIAQAEGWSLDPVEQQTPHLLHAPVGAVIAREAFGVTDEGVLAAIANHTLGQPSMDALSCIVYLADTLEPGRGDTPELDALRQHSFVDLTQAVYRTADYSLTQLIAQGRPIHPRAIATRNHFLRAEPSPPKRAAPSALSA